jgi:hypothetical protein
MKASLFCISLLFIIVGNSCSHYIDKTTSEKEIAIAQGAIKFYPDSNALTYKSTVSLSADKEKYLPKPFHIQLPKGIEWYEISNSTSFVFFYKRNQLLAALLNPPGDPLSKDTAYVPNKQQIDQFVGTFTVESGKKYDIRNVSFKKNRKQMIYVKGNARILLYNILPGDFHTFVSCVMTFKFL